MAKVILPFVRALTRLDRAPRRSLVDQPGVVTHDELEYQRPRSNLLILASPRTQIRNGQLVVSCDRSNWQILP